MAEENEPNVQDHMHYSGCSGSIQNLEKFGLHALVSEKSVTFCGHVFCEQVLAKQQKPDVSIGEYW